MYVHDLVLSLGQYTFFYTPTHIYGQLRETNHMQNNRKDHLGLSMMGKQQLSDLYQLKKLVNQPEVSCHRWRDKTMTHRVE